MKEGKQKKPRRPNRAADGHMDECVWKHDNDDVDTLGCRNADHV